MQMQSNAEGEIQLKVPAGWSFLSFSPVLCAVCFGCVVRPSQSSTRVIFRSLSAQVKSPHHDSHFNLDLKLYPVTPAVQCLPVLKSIIGTMKNRQSLI